MDGDVIGSTPERQRVHILVEPPPLRSTGLVTSGVRAVGLAQDELLLKVLIVDDVA
jgi:hypothetical protein